MSDIERDSQTSSYELSNEDVLSHDYFSHVLSNFSNGNNSTQLIVVDANIKAFILLFADGEELHRIPVNSGVSHIPLVLNFARVLTVYVRPHDDVSDEEAENGSVSVNVI